MARISTYAEDIVVSDRDRIIGTDGDQSNQTKNFSVRTLTNFINEDLFDGFTDGEVITIFEDTIIPSSIQSTFVTTVFVGTDPQNSVVATGPNEITFGSGITFVDPQVAIDSYVVLVNGNDKYTSLITGISQTNRTVTLAKAFTASELLTFGPAQGITNVATFLRYTGISVQGGVLDAITGRTANINPNGPASIRFWYGTQVEYDTQFPGGVGLELDVEYTIYTPLVP